VTRAAVFLDRDGTLNVRPRPHHYVTAETDFRWLPSAPEALAELSHAGYVLAVVSNQRGVARGLVTNHVLRRIEDRMQFDLGRLGVRVEAFRYCPHDLDEACHCRKPRPGLLLQLARELSLDLNRSWMVGDSLSDVQAGKAAGCRTAYVGNGEEHGGADMAVPSIVEFSRSLQSQPGAVADRSGGLA
jgi:D-glycero-D-manno-heptose 1,7-bisphosphate phosphatase